MFSVKPFKSVLDLIKAFPDEETCIKHLETLIWDNNIVSPFDKTSKVYACKNYRYKCCNTNKYFNIKTGTIFENSKIPLQKWFLAIYLFTVHKRGISSYQLATDLSITQKAAWYMLSKIRYAMEHKDFFVEENESVQIDETFVGGKNKNRHKDKKVKNSQGRSFKDKTPVLGIKKDNGNIKTMVIANTKGETIKPILYDIIAKGATIKTDEWTAYNGLNTDYKHSYTDHSKGIYVNGEATTNAVENAWSHFKRTINSTYFVVSRKHLQGYCNEFDFRFNYREMTSNERFNLFLKSTPDKKITYAKLISE